jgi:hypothetical protein
LSWKFLLLLYLVLAALAAAAQADPAWMAHFELAARHDPEQHSRPGEALAEVVKQAAEQPLHFAMAAAPIWLSRCLTAVPWYGWATLPALAYREWRQWPSQRWWDPPLDAAFLLLGAVTATWSAKFAGPWPLPLLRRRHWRVAGWFRA